MYGCMECMDTLHRMDIGCWLTGWMVVGWILLDGCWMDVVGCWMDNWMDGWILLDGCWMDIVGCWMDNWMDGWLLLDGYTAQDGYWMLDGSWMDNWMDGCWMDILHRMDIGCWMEVGWMDGWMDGWILLDGYTAQDGYWMLDGSWMDNWMDGCWMDILHRMDIGCWMEQGSLFRDANSYGRMDVGWTLGGESIIWQQGGTGAHGQGLWQTWGHQGHIFSRLLTNLHLPVGPTSHDFPGSHSLYEKGGGNSSWDNQPSPFSVPGRT